MKKNILFIIPWFPYPMKSGGHQAIFNGIAAIKDDFNIYLTYEAWEGEEYRNAEEGFLQKIPQAHLLPLIHKVKKEKTSLKLRVLRKINRIIHNILNIPFQQPKTEKKNELEKEWFYNISPQSPDFFEHIYNICQKYEFDIIQVEMPRLISHVLTLPQNTKKIYVHHEIGFVRRNLEIQNKKTIYARACKRFADFNEIHLLNLYDTIITLSPIDAEKLRDAGVSIPIKSSFAIIDSSTELETRTSNGKLLTFIGPDNHSPNIVGITWFLDNCWKKLKEIDHEYKLTIIGRWSEKHIQEYMEKYADISFLGYVPDLESAIKETIMIVPITIGSGIRMKILEACSKGIPFVSTTIGAEGIPVENEKDCFITDNPKEFIEDIIKLQDPELQERFIINANSMVQKYYSIDALKNNRISIYRSLID